MERISGDRAISLRETGGKATAWVCWTGSVPLRSGRGACAAFRATGMRHATQLSKERLLHSGQPTCNFCSTGRSFLQMSIIFIAYYLKAANIYAKISFSACSYIHRVNNCTIYKYSAF